MSAQPEPGSDPPSGRQDLTGPSVAIFFIVSTSLEFARGTARLRITATLTALPNQEEAELLTKETGESYSTAPNGSTPH